MPTVGSLFFIFISLLTACRPSPFNEPNDYFGIEKDSVRKLLTEVKDVRHLSKAEQAAYALLSLRIEEDSIRMDSLQQAAYQYYSSQNDSLHLAYCYYWGGLAAEINNKDLLAIAHYLRCAEIYPKQDKFLAHVHLFLGFTFEALGDNREAIKWFRQSVRYHEQQGSWEKAAFALMWQTPLYLKPDINQPDSAIYYGLINIGYMQHCHSVFLDTPYMTISQAYSMKGNFQKALEYNELSKKAQGRNKTLRQNANQVSILFHLEQYDSALAYALRIPEDYYNRHENDLWIARIYEKMGRYQEALDYEKKYLNEETNKNSAAARKNLSNLRLLIERNETTEQNQQFKAEAERRLLIQLTAISVTIILFLLAFGYHHYRIQRSEQRLKERELEQLTLKHHLEIQKRKEVELREQFFRQLNYLSLQADKDRRRPFSETEWELLINNANAAFGGFTTKLKEHYPLLNNEDIRYCILVKMGLTQNEIAQIVCREKVSVKKRIRRIAIEKMEATEGELLIDIINKI